MVGEQMNICAMTRNERCGRGRDRALRALAALHVLGRAHGAFKPKFENLQRHTAAVCSDCFRMGLRVRARAVSWLVGLGFMGFIITIIDSDTMIVHKYYDDSQSLLSIIFSIFS